MPVKELERDLRSVEKYRDELREELSSTIDELIACRKERNELRAENIQLRSKIISLQESMRTEE